MKEKVILDIERMMVPYLNTNQVAQLKATLLVVLGNKEIKDVDEVETSTVQNDELLNAFTAAKSIEGCSARTVRYYSSTIAKVLSGVQKDAVHITTNDLRQYLADYEKESGCSKGNLDNIRRVLSSFFAWLENENYIVKSPVRRIHKIKTPKLVKETYSDETIEIIQDGVKYPRDEAIINLLYSTGMRVGELVRLNISDVDFENRECKVYGKGDKERIVYFDAKTKIHLMRYLSDRTDTNEALFVSLLKPHNRLEISGVEVMLRKLGRSLGVGEVYPHKFRRSCATRAIDKGMPIEQVQKLLGHTKIDTTMEYAMVSQSNVKTSHRKYIA